LTIILTGGGSGGHITPILAVAEEIKRREPASNIVYIGQTGDGLGDIPSKHPAIDKVYTIRAGKLRRYHGEGLKQVLDLPTTFKNIRDIFYVLIGIWQSHRLLRRIKPSIIFIKGGFVGVPVGLAAAQLHIPYITHDSDALPGLANRIISRWAIWHAVALPTEVYNYPASKTITTGIPLQANFVPVTTDLKRDYRQKLGLPLDSKVLFVIGGGLGSQGVNNAVAETVPHLLAEFKNLRVIQVAGRNNREDLLQTYKAKLSDAEMERLNVLGFIDDVYLYSGAADLIITRAGATNLAEFSLQGKACIVVPSSFLAGGHQLKNADYLAEQGAAVVLQEKQLFDDPNRLAQQASELLGNQAKLDDLAKKLALFAKPNSTTSLCNLILEQAKPDEA